MYTKYTNFGDFGAVGPYFKATMVKFGMRVRTCDFLSQAKFYFKKSLKGVYPFLAKIYQKLAILAILGAVNPHFKSDNAEIRHKGAGLEFPPPRQNL